MSRGFVWRFIIYGIVVAYVLLDLKVIKGPIHGWVLAQHGTDVSVLREQGVAALVYGQPLMRDQVTYRMEEHLYVRGRRLSDLSDAESDLLYQHCRQELILEHLLRIKTHHNERHLPAITPASLSLEVQYDESAFSDEREQRDALSRQGFIDGELALRAQAHLQQRYYLARQIQVTPLSPEEVAENPPQPMMLTLPPLRHIRHIYRSTAREETAEEAQRTLQMSLAPYRTGWASFAEVSQRVCHDPRAKKQRGDIGWVSPHRLPEGMAETIFSLPLREPTLIHSPLGWHYLEVIEEKPAREVPETPAAMEARLQNHAREEGLKLYLRHLFTREQDHVQLIDPNN